MDTYRQWLKAQIRSLDKLKYPDQNQFDDLAQVIEEAGRRGARAGLPGAVRVCGKIRGGPLGVEAARELLAACLAACRESGGADDLAPNGNGPLTVKQASERYGIGERTLYDLCASNALTHVRIGNKRGGIRIHPEDIESYLAASNGQPLKYL